MTKEIYPAWIVAIESPDDEPTEHENSILLPITDRLAFNYSTWESHPDRAINRYRPLSRGQFHNLKQSLLLDGMDEPIEIDGESWQIVGGYHRLKAWHALVAEGNEAVRNAGFTVLEFPEGTDIAAYQDRKHFLRRKIGQQELREKIAEAIRNDPAQPNRRIAITFGVSPTTVATVSADLEADGLVRPKIRTGPDGVPQDTEAITTANKTKTSSRKVQAPPSARSIDDLNRVDPSTLTKRAAKLLAAVSEPIAAAHEAREHGDLAALEDAFVGMVQAIFALKAGMEIPSPPVECNSNVVEDCSASESQVELVELNEGLLVTRAAQDAFHRALKLLRGDDTAEVPWSWLGNGILFTIEDAVCMRGGFMADVMSQPSDNRHVSRKRGRIAISPEGRIYQWDGATRKQADTIRSQSTPPQPVS